MSIIELIVVLLTSTTKFVLSFPIAMEYGLNFIETFLVTTLGGIIGVVFFAYLTDPVSKAWNYIYRKIKGPETEPKKIRKRFTKRNRTILKIKNQFGLIGLAITTPVLLSIPIGTFFTVKIYPKMHKSLLYLTVSVVVWSFILSLIGTFMNVRISEFIMALI